MTSSYEAMRFAQAQRAYKRRRPTKPSAPAGPGLQMSRDELVRKYAPLVYRIAKRVRRRTGYAVELDDLICEGTIGLLQAAERFDKDRETDFEHLASVRVHGAMLDALRRLDPLSQRRRREARKHQKMRARLEAQLGRSPEPEEMAEALGIDLESYHKLSSELSVQPALSLDDMQLDVRDATVTPDRVAQARERASMIKELILGMPERQRIVLSLIYYNELSQKEVAQVLEVTEARVSQLHKEALERMRRKLKSNARIGEDAW